METLNASTFEAKVFQGDLPVIVDFYADWCGPCRRLSPVLEEISREYEGKVRIFKVDTEVSPELAAKFQVRGIPALLFVPPAGGNPTLSAGFLPKEQLERKIEDLLHVKK